MKSMEEGHIENGGKAKMKRMQTLTIKGVTPVAHGKVEGQTVEQKWRTVVLSLGGGHVQVVVIAVPLHRSCPNTPILNQWDHVPIMCQSCTIHVPIIFQP